MVGAFPRLALPSGFSWQAGLLVSQKLAELFHGRVRCCGSPLVRDSVTNPAKFEPMEWNKEAGGISDMVFEGACGEELCTNRRRQIQSRSFVSGILSLARSFSSFLVFFSLFPSTVGTCPKMMDSLTFLI